jgi:shikimate dehydrogenase
MKLYGLIGYPLGHSFSKKYFTEKFQREGLAECSYELFPIDSIRKLPELLNQHPELKGLNVTIPYKEQVLAYISNANEEVKAIGAANTIKIVEGDLMASNTDITGFEMSFKKKLKPSHHRALVLGTGGSSKAIRYVLKKLAIDFLLVSRNEIVSNKTINYSSINEKIIHNYPVIINCTPAGMFPNDKEFPQIPYQYLTEKNYLFDLVYKPEKTVFLQKGEEKGSVIQNGYEMLVIQAEESWKIWNQSPLRH